MESRKCSILVLHKVFIVLHILIEFRTFREKRKLDKKIYYRHTGYIGGLKQISARKLLQKKPDEVLRLAVRRMLPKNSLGRRQLKKLKIYTGSDHPHQAQKPETFEI